MDLIGFYYFLIVDSWFIMRYMLVVLLLSFTFPVLIFFSFFNLGSRIESGNRILLNKSLVFEVQVMLCFINN
jgi:hypothetical protein